MLQFQQVSKTYRQGSRTIEALRELDLTIGTKGFYAVMGPSGSGKSTLLHLAAGLDRPDRGRVQVDDHDLMTLSQRQLTSFRRDYVGIVFQQFNLIPTLTARQNIELPGVIARRSRSWVVQRTDELLDELDLTQRADHRPDAMSGGEQQRVAIARALLFSPPLLLADEPTGNLDSASSEKLWQLMADLSAAHDMTVVMVTHEPAAVAHTSRAYVLSDGRAIGDFAVNGMDTSDVATRYQQLSRPASA